MRHVARDIVEMSGTTYGKPMVATRRIERLAYRGFIATVNHLTQHALPTIHRQSRSRIIQSIRRRVVRHLLTENVVSSIVNGLDEASDVTRTQITARMIRFATRPESLTSEQCRDGKAITSALLGLPVKLSEHDAAELMKIQFLLDLGT